MTDAQIVDTDDEDAEWRCKDYRLTIVTRSVGRRQNYDSPLSKKVLNSIHRYLTGEFYYPKKIHGTAASPDIDELRHHLCIWLANREYPTFEDIVENASTDQHVPPSDPDAKARTRPFRKEELAALHHALNEEEDKRPSPKKEEILDA